MIPDAMTDPAGLTPAVLALLAAPGPTNALLAAAGASAGMRAALHLLVGEVGGYLLAIGCIIFAVGPLLATYPAAIELAKAAAAGYLLILALRLWRRPASPDAGETAQPTVRFGDVFMATLLNPKAVILALAILPAAPVMESPLLLALLILVVLVSGAAWIGIGAAAKNSVRALAAERYVARTSAIVLTVFAGAYVASAAAALFA
jgi:threonine/homoserine/homoserine lactone efflux protein